MSLPIRQRGVYAGIPDAEYHGAQWALSSSGARYLLRAPALFVARMERPRTSKAFDLGRAVHAKVLGVGAEIVTAPPEGYVPPQVLTLPDGTIGVTCPPEMLSKSGTMATAAAKEWRAAEEAAGSVVLTASEMWRADAASRGLVVVTPSERRTVDAMAEAVLANPDARDLVERPGIAEASVIAQDPATGEWLRARPDYLPDRTGEQAVMVDLKTADNADPRDFGRTCGRYGYQIQSAWYVEALRLARGDEHPRIVFVAVEKEPPHLVSVTELQALSHAAGMAARREAIDLWHACRETDHWPGYTPGIQPIDIPNYLLDDDPELSL